MKKSTEQISNSRFRKASPKITRFLHPALLLGIPVLLTGCASNTDEFDKLSEENKKLRLEIQQMKSDIASVNGTPTTSKAPNDTKATDAKADISTGSNTDATESGTTTSTKTYPDIAGNFGEKEILDLIKVGVFQPNGEKFDPQKPITRAEFIEWLVKSNNLIRRKKDFIRTADAGSPSSFTDLTESNPYFKYIQGMADAGWSIGFTDKTFRPDQPLTREQMIGIKTPIDWNNETYDNYHTKFWTDGAKISKTFIRPMSTEAFAFYEEKHNNNWSRLFGKTRICNPQKPVSRAEAAVCVWCIGRNPTDGYSAAKGTPAE